MMNEQPTAPMIHSSRIIPSQRRQLFLFGLLAIILVLLVFLTKHSGIFSSTPSPAATIEILEKSSAPVTTTADVRARALQNLEKESKPVTLTPAQRLDEQALLHTK